MPLAKLYQTHTYVILVYTVNMNVQRVSIYACSSTYNPTEYLESRSSKYTGQGGLESNQNKLSPHSGITYPFVKQ